MSRGRSLLDKHSSMTSQRGMVVSSFEENFKIYLRIKPVLQYSSETESQLALRQLSSKEVEIVSPYYMNDNDQIYHYDEVFGSVAKNREVFDRTMLTPIHNALNGLNSTVFIYGMTGAGKTYTMFNNFGNGRENDQGIVGLTIDHLFEEIKREQMQAQILISFFEIYNENIRDLLSEAGQNLSIMQDPVKGVFINELKQLHIDKSQQAKHIILQGINRRAMNATKSNEVSSRSHAILQFIIRKYITNSSSNEVSMMQSKFYMIDLAGNEKAGNNQSKRFVEGVNINKSLLTLGKCITILAEQKKNTFIPFRDSKLTRILKESLGGNSKTVMIACVSSVAKFYEETLNTLKYSTIAKKIKNKGIKNNIKIITRKQLPPPQLFVDTAGEWAVTTEEQSAIEDIIKEIMQINQDLCEGRMIKKQLQQSRTECSTSLKEGKDIENNSHTLREVDRMIPKIEQACQQFQRQLETLKKKMLLQIGKIKQQCFSQKLGIVDYNSAHKQQTKVLTTCSYNTQSIIENTKVKKVIEQEIQKISERRSQLASCQSRQAKQCNSLTIKVGQSYKIGQNAKAPLTLQNKQNVRVNCNPLRNSKFDLRRNNSSISVCPQLSKNNSVCSSRNQTTIETSQLSRRTTSNHTALNSNPSTVTCSNVRIDPLQQKQIQIYLNNGHDDKESFLKKLRDADRNSRNIERREIELILQQQHNKRYELSNVQASMLRKLKFFSKEVV